MRYGLPVPNSVNESDHLSQIGSLIRDARKHRGWTQNELAAHLGTSQSAINRIERGGQNVTLDNLARISEALRTPLMRFGPANPHLRVTGPTKLQGSIEVKTSKNAGVALLCASLLNQGRTTLRRVARIEEVNRLLEVLGSIGVETRWLNDDNDLLIVPPKELDLSQIDEEAARRTRSVIMFLGPYFTVWTDSLCHSLAAATWGLARSSRTCLHCSALAWRSRRLRGNTKQPSTRESPLPRPSF